jgi:nitroreductase
MNTVEAIYERRSVRRFSDKQLIDAEIECLLNAAVQAPTATNSQPWVFSVIRGSQMLQNLSDGAKAFLITNMDTIHGMQKYAKVLAKPKYNIFYNAECLLVIYAKAEGPNPEYDCCLAAQNVMLAATEMGLGSCWIGFAGHYLNLPEIKATFNIPEQYTAVAPIILGHPKFKMPSVKKKPPEILYWQR